MAWQEVGADELGLSFATRKNFENKEEMQKISNRSLTLTVPKEAGAFLDQNIAQLKNSKQTERITPRPPVDEMEQKDRPVMHSVGLGPEI